MTTDEIKVGDRVRVKPVETLRASLDGIDRLDGLYFNRSMEELSGKCYEVERIERETGHVRLLPDDGWIWHPSWLEKIADDKDAKPERITAHPGTKSPTPAIDLIPVGAWKVQRINDIMRVIVHYIDNGHTPKDEWYSELRGLLNDVEVAK